METSARPREKQVVCCYHWTLSLTFNTAQPWFHYLTWCDFSKMRTRVSKGVKITTKQNSHVLQMSKVILPYITDPPSLSSHARWKSVEPALMDARTVTAVRNKTLHHFDDDNTIYTIYTIKKHYTYTYTIYYTLYNYIIYYIVYIYIYIYTRYKHYKTKITVRRCKVNYQVVSRRKEWSQCIMG